MNRRVVSILLIEDDSGDVALIDELLTEIEFFPLRLEVRQSLGGGLARLNDGGIDAVLLDLGLPDSAGIGTVSKVCTPYPEVPVVVLTGYDDEVLGLEAVGVGAQDYLVKGSVDSRTLLRSIRYAVERRRLQEELDGIRERKKRDTEIRSMERLTDAYPALGSTQTAPLRSRAVDAFDELVDRYSELIELAFLERTIKEEHNVSKRLLAMARRLAFFKAGPRDVVEIYGESVRKMFGEQAQTQQRGYLDQSRYVLLDLMGRLVSIYLESYMRCLEVQNSK